MTGNRNETAPDASEMPALHGSLLEGRNNPRSGLDYAVMLQGTAPQSGCRVRLRYVPDKLLVDSGSFIDYLAALAPADQETPEMLALALLDDINNEIVPRWVQIAVSAEGCDTPVQTVILVDRQPNWDNPAILGTLPPL